MILVWCVFPLPFSQVVIYGSLLAAHTYAGHAPAENMRLLGIVYKHTFQIFRTAKVSMPAIDLAAITFDPTKVFGYVAALGHIDSLDAAELLEGARGLLAFSFVLSILKTVISVCAAAFAAGAGEQLDMCKNVQFSDCARWATERKTEDGVSVHEHIDGLDAMFGKAAGEAAGADQEPATERGGGDVIGTTADPLFYSVPEHIAGPDVLVDDDDGVDEHQPAIEVEAGGAFKGLVGLIQAIGRFLNFNRKLEAELRKLEAAHREREAARREKRTAQLREHAAQRDERDFQRAQSREREKNTLACSFRAGDEVCVNNRGAWMPAAIVSNTDGWYEVRYNDGNETAPRHATDDFLEVDDVIAELHGDGVSVAPLRTRFVDVSRIRPIG